MKSRARRIVHVVRRFDPMLGGLERYVGDIARAQASAGDDVTVVTLNHDVNGLFSGRLPREEVVEGVRIVRLSGIGSPRFGITFQPQELLRRLRRADVVHMHDVRFMLGTIAFAGRLMGHPTLLHTHGLIFGTRRLWWLKTALSRLYYEPVLRLTHVQIVASSASDAELVAKTMPGLASRTRTIENGVDLRALLEAVRAPFQGRIAVLGRVTQLKGVERMLRVLPSLDSGFSLVVHGAEEGNEIARLMQVANEVGVSARVAFTGAFTAAGEPQLLSSAAVAVFPSMSEGFGIALVDAMAAGVPVVASDIEAHRQILSAVDIRLLVDFNEPRTVAAAIVGVLARSDEELAALGAVLRKRATMFSVERLRGDLESLYAEVGVAT